MIARWLGYRGKHRAVLEFIDWMTGQWDHLR